MDDRILLLDVMGTLVRDPFYEVVPEFFGLSMDQLLAAKHPTSWVSFERDEIDEAMLLSNFFADGRTVDGPGLKRTMQSAYAWLDGIEQLLEDLREQAVPMHALSNYPKWYALIESQLGVSKYLSWSFVSCNTGLRKPDSRAYLGACRSLGVSPERCVFVDDRAVNCEAADSVGMTSIMFEDAQQLRSALQSAGLLAR